MAWILSLIQFVRQDARRFAWEIGGAILLSAVSWGVGYFLNNRTLQACQDERTELLKQSKAAQAYRDSVFYAVELAKKDQVIRRKEDEINRLREKMVLDSLDRLSDLEHMRAINQRYKGGGR